MPTIEISDDALDRVLKALRPWIDALPDFSQERYLAERLATNDAELVAFVIEDFIRKQPPKPAQTPESLAASFNASGEPRRVMIAPEAAEWLDRWASAYTGESDITTISKKIHLLIAAEMTRPHHEPLAGLKPDGLS